MASIDSRIHFRDVARRESSAFDELINTVARLTAVEKKRPLSKAEAAEKARAEAIIDEIGKSERNNNKAVEVCDPLFVAARTLLNEQAMLAPELRSHKNGRLIFDQPNTAEAQSSQTKAASSSSGSGEYPYPGDPDITLVGLSIGLLMLEAAEAPPVRVVPQSTNRTGATVAAGTKGNGATLYPDTRHPNSRTFTREFFRALGEARSYFPLAEKVLTILAIEGDPDGRRGADPQCGAEEFARVMRGLADANVGDDEPQLRRKVNEALDRVQNVGGDDEIGDSVIDLPDLEEIVDENIIAENVRAMGPMIVSAMFDELKVFQVVDRIVEQFQQGMLPIGPGRAGKALYRYWREAPNRMSEQERRNFAAITLGIPGGNPNGMINSEFNDLWLRFVSSVSSFIRQNEVDTLLRSATPSPISHQQVRKAARDLAANLSLHGYGMAHFAAREVQSQIKFMIELLQDPEIRGSYGARDMWQVVDQVATYELGGAKTSSRYRTLATCGTIITAWLANNVARINRTTGPLIDIDQVRNPDVAENHKATRNPTDYDLVNACELWLADTATSDSRIEEMAQPREAPQMTSKPIPIPALARDMLDGIGDIGLGLGRESQSAFARNGAKAGAY
ncbi:hypothetical protein [Sphingosinicella sp. BN140058]|uniref:hypothetical protein n=1 Tax=Sphingosinicella sp. BN140058 TaxID=1892855 RepID=UPI00101360D6|nr:hypothetical protein [Sphingosinicella sp. BN140058]QAY75975.1 hypothetical protein ETR14_05115 [Sphingosinicella sp. BN140058]